MDKEYLALPHDDSMSDVGERDDPAPAPAGLALPAPGGGGASLATDGFGGISALRPDGLSPDPSGIPAPHLDASMSDSGDESGPAPSDALGAPALGRGSDSAILARALAKAIPAADAASPRPAPASPGRLPPALSKALAVTRDLRRSSPAGAAPPHGRLPGPGAGPGAELAAHERLELRHMLGLPDASSVLDESDVAASDAGADAGAAAGAPGVGPAGAAAGGAGAGPEQGSSAAARLRAKAAEVRERALSGDDAGAAGGGGEGAAAEVWPLAARIRSQLSRGTGLGDPARRAIDFAEPARAAEPAAHTTASFPAAGDGSLRLSPAVPSPPRSPGISRGLQSPPLDGSAVGAEAPETPRRDAAAVTPRATPKSAPRSPLEVLSCRLGLERGDGRSPVGRAVVSPVSPQLATALAEIRLRKAEEGGTPARGAAGSGVPDFVGRSRELVPSASASPGSGASGSAVSTPASAGSGAGPPADTPLSGVSSATPGEPSSPFTPAGSSRSPGSRSVLSASTPGSSQSVRDLVLQARRLMEKCDVVLRKSASPQP